MQVPVSDIKLYVKNKLNLHWIRKVSFIFISTPDAIMRPDLQEDSDTIHNGFAYFFNTF